MLDLDQIQRLDNASREKYAALEKLFEQKGFKFLVDWAKAQAQAASNSVLFATNWEQHCFNRGAQLAYENFANIEEFTEREFAQVAEDALKAEIDAMEEELESRVDE